MTGTELQQSIAEKTSLRGIIAKFFTYSVLANGPWILVVVCVTITGYYIAQITSLVDRAILGFAISLSTPLSLVLTAGFQALETKVVLDKVAIGDYATAKRFAVRVLLVTVAFAVGIIAITNIIGYFLDMLTYTLAFSLIFISLSILWVATAPILGLRKFKELTLIFAVASIGGYTSSVFMAQILGLWGVVIFQSLGFLTAACGIYVYLIYLLAHGKDVVAALAARRVALFHVLEDIRKKFERGEIYLKEYKKLVKEFGGLLVKVEQDLSKISKSRKGEIVGIMDNIRYLLPLFIANILYFLTLWADRIFVWLTYGQNIEGAALGINTLYETGVNVAQWVLIPAIGLIALLMEMFTPNFQRAVSVTYQSPLVKLEENLNSFYKFYKKMFFTVIGCVAIIVLIINIFAENIIGVFISPGLSDTITIFGITIPATIYVFRVASIAVIFHAATILNFLALMYLERHGLNSWLMGIILVINIVICPLLSVVLMNFYQAILGYLLSFFIGAVMGIKLVKKTIFDFPYQAFSSLL
ncbi:MAG: exopolysaccharide Pel transporter PelG [Candidatus Odinarchaeia archaeon]